jgi:hypothetical protein
MMPGMQQMQQPQQLTPAQMIAQKPIKRGTSKAVPVVVSAGLAVGVFCGLLFGVGVDKGEAAPPSKSHPMKKDGTPDTDVPAALQPTVNDGPKKDPPKAGSDSGSAVAAAGSGSGSAAPAVGSGSGSAVAAVAKPKLAIELAPNDIAAGAKILVDGKEITGTSLEYEVDPATNKAKTPSVVVTVKAQGYKDAEQKVALDGDTTVKFEMVKGKSTLPKDPAVAAGSGSAAPATTPPATTPPANTAAAKPPVTTPPGNTAAAKPPVTTPPVTTPPANTGSAAKPPVHHHNPGNGSAKKPGGLIDI